MSRTSCTDGMLGYDPSLTFGITRTSELSALAPAALYPQWNFFALISATGWVGPRATVRRQKEYVTGKFRKTLPGIEPGTARIVAARPSNCYYGNNTQTQHSKAVLSSRHRVSISGHGTQFPLWTRSGDSFFFGRRPFSLWRETFTKVSDYLLRFVQEFCLVLYDLK